MNRLRFVYWQYRSMNTELAPFLFNRQPKAHVFSGTRVRLRLTVKRLIERSYARQSVV